MMCAWCTRNSTSCLALVLDTEAHVVHAYANDTSECVSKLRYAGPCAALLWRHQAEHEASVVECPPNVLRSASGV